MADDMQSAQSVRCKCGATAKFITSIPRLGDKPQQNIFQCGECQEITWVEIK